MNNSKENESVMVVENLDQAKWLKDQIESEPQVNQPLKDALAEFKSSQSCNFENLNKKL